MPRLKVHILSFISVFIIFPTLQAAQVEEYELKAAIIQKMIAYIKWPNGHLQDMEKIQFGIIGPTPITKYLKNRSRLLKVDNRSVLLKDISELRDIKKCNILFIGRSTFRKLENILAVTENLPILTLSDTEGFAKKGVLINLYKAKDRIKFEINRKAVAKTGLKFSSNLYKLAKIIN